MDVENMSGDDEDPNAQTYQRRICEEKTRIAVCKESTRVIINHIDSKHYQDPRLCKQEI